jgi:hypothetical protein
VEAKSKSIRTELKIERNEELEEGEKIKGWKTEKKGNYHVKTFKM